MVHFCRSYTVFPEGSCHLCDCPFLLSNPQFDSLVNSKHSCSSCSTRLWIKSVSFPCFWTLDALICQITDQNLYFHLCSNAFGHTPLPTNNLTDPSNPRTPNFLVGLFMKKGWGFFEAIAQMLSEFSSLLKKLLCFQPMNKVILFVIYIWH